MKVSIQLFGLLALTLFYSGCFANSVRTEAEDFLERDSVRLKRWAVQDDISSLRFSVSTSKEIEGVAIWDASDDLIFPDRNSIIQFSEDKTLNELSRMVFLLKAANTTAWELGNVEATSLLYCSVDAVSICLVLVSDDLALALNLTKAQLIDELFSRPDNWRILYSLLFVLVIFLLVYYFYLMTRSKIPSLSESSGSFYFGDMHVSIRKLRAKNCSIEIELTHRDILLLEHLASRPNEVIAKKELYGTGWGRDFVATSRALDQHILTLRRKLDPEKTGVNLIETVHGVGYRYVIN